MHPHYVSTRVTPWMPYQRLVPSFGRLGSQNSLADRIAAALQMGGETACGAVLLLRQKNRYAAAALVRQLVELEYLLCLFAKDKDEPLKWASMDLEAVRKEYLPARMRERCGNRFRASEYSIHCQIGGHPRFAAAYLGLAGSSLKNANQAVAAWLHYDACALRLTEAEAAFSAEVTVEAEVVH